MCSCRYAKLGLDPSPLSLILQRGGCKGAEGRRSMDSTQQKGVHAPAASARTPHGGWETTHAFGQHQARHAHDMLASLSSLCTVRTTSVHLVRPMVRPGQACSGACFQAISLLVSARTRDFISACFRGPTNLLVINIPSVLPLEKLNLWLLNALQTRNTSGS